MEREEQRKECVGVEGIEDLYEEEGGDTLRYESFYIEDIKQVRCMFILRKLYDQ